MTNAARRIALDLVAANPASVHLTSHGEVEVETNKREGLWIDLGASASGHGMASYQDWVDAANRALEYGPSTRYA